MTREDLAEGSVDGSMSNIFNPTTKKYYNMRADLDPNTDFYNYILGTCSKSGFLKDDTKLINNAVYLIMCHAEATLDTTLLTSIIYKEDPYTNKQISMLMPCFSSLSNFLNDNIKSKLPDTDFITKTIVGSMTSLSPMLCVFYFTKQKQKIKSIFNEKTKNIICFKITKIYNSAKQPALIEFYSAPLEQSDFEKESRTSNYSRGTEFNFSKIVKPSIILKKDKKALLTCAVFEMFNYFNFIWNSNKSKIYAKTIKNTVFIYNQQSYGVIEYIEGTITIKQLSALNIPDSEESSFSFDRFFYSSLGSLIACFILGIRDRHYENILFNKKCEMLQIDFEFMFGEQANPDTGPFPITNSFKKKIGNKWKEFVEKAVDAFMFLRERRNNVENITEILFGKVVERRKLFKHFKGIWKVEYSEEKMRDKMRKMISEAPNLKKTKIKNKIHQISNSFR